MGPFLKTGGVRMELEFSTASRIVFGEGASSRIPEIAESLGCHALLVTGSSRERADFVQQGLSARGLSVSVFQVPSEPITDLVARGADMARKEGCDHVIGVGGGSVLDASKAISAMMTNEGDLWNYLEIVGAGEPLKHRAAPCVAVPTTAGTGAEVTRNAVLESPEDKVKVSMRSQLMLPAVALVDPELTYGLSREITACTGLDALTQLLEAFVGRHANPLTDSLCREGLDRARSLRAAWEDPDGQSRTDMSLAALLSGMALANSKLGAVHGLAGPLGGMYPAPHGALCGRLLPLVIEVNLRALEDRDPENRARDRYREAFAILTGKQDADIQEGLDWLRDLCQTLKVPSLDTYGISREKLDLVIPKALRASSMKGNPVPLEERELREILERAL